MKHIFGKRAWTIFMFMLFSSLTGCDSSSDDGNAIHICNGDNHEYRVELHWDADNRLVDELQLEEWHDLTGEQCEEFEDVSEGKYYISIYEGDRSDVSDRSDSFYLENGETESFWINDTGNID